MDSDQTKLLYKITHQNMTGEKSKSDIVICYKLVRYIYPIDRKLCLIQIPNEM